MVEGAAAAEDGEADMVNASVELDLMEMFWLNLDLLIPYVHQCRKGSCWCRKELDKDV